jgi:hypothetical protein
MLIISKSQYSQKHADHSPGSKIIDRTSVSKRRDESACVHDDPAKHMAHLYQNNANLL